MKNALALTHERWERWTAVGAGLAPRRIAAGAGPLGLSPRLLLGALAGELATVVFLFASGSVPSVLVRSLQLFLRF